ncbi:MAG: hypothetical protein QOA62_10225 [Nitrososphaeraceae archaeon]|nr:hypothetical protein [Nitrososphaeraceae archaeon]
MIGLRIYLRCPEEIVKYRVKIIKTNWFSTLSWGCIPELYPNCMGMTNSSRTYLGIVVGALIGAIVSWWIFNRQKKTSDKQDYTLNRIEQL